MYYAGIGSRNTPTKMLQFMSLSARILASYGYILRSGGANGADSAFEMGCDLVNGKKQIFLPWPEFNNKVSEFERPSSEATEIAQKYHPHWSNLRRGGKALHSRNTHQILGPDCKTPVDFVVCWTNKTGGTQQALRIAKDLNIKIYNLRYEDEYDSFNMFLKTLFIF